MKAFNFVFYMAVVLACSCTAWQESASSKHDQDDGLKPRSAELCNDQDVAVALGLTPHPSGYPVISLDANECAEFSNNGDARCLDLAQQAGLFLELDFFWLNTDLESYCGCRCANDPTPPPSACSLNLQEDLSNTSFSDYEINGAHHMLVIGKGEDSCVDVSPERCDVVQSFTEVPLSFSVVTTPDGKTLCGCQCDNNCFGLRTLKAFVLDSRSDGVDLASINPILAWNATPDLGGVDLADLRCQTLADLNGLSGLYKAFLSSSQRDFYAELEPGCENLPLQNPHGTVAFGTTQSLNDLRDSNKNSIDTLWDGLLFFRANGSRIDCATGFPTFVSYELATGMNPDGSVADLTCASWQSAAPGQFYYQTGYFFDRGPGMTAIDPNSGTFWHRCSPLSIVTRRPWHVLSSQILRECDKPWLDGYFCVQVAP